MPTPTITYRTDLAYKSGTSDKVYHIWVENVGANWFVKFRYGRRGSTLTDGIKVGPTDTRSAEKVYLDIVKEKIGKGYKTIKPPEPKKGEPHTSKDFKRKPLLGVAAVSSADLIGASEVIQEKTKDGEKITATWTLGDTTSCQLLNPITEDDLKGFIDDDKWVLQEKHDGRRMLLGFSEGITEAHNRKGQLLPPPEEYCSALQSSFEGFAFVIDGEACGDKFYAFDILWLEGLDCRKLPLHERLINLGMLIRSGAPQDVIRQVVTAETKGEKKKMLETIRKRNGEGVTIKDRDCPYTASRPNSYGPALKFKFVETVSCQVIGVNAKRSVEIGLYRDELGRKHDVAISVGNVTIPANFDIPEVGDVVEVQYLYAYKGGSLYQPVYRGERDDVPVDTFNELKYKPGEVPASVLRGKIEDLSAEIMAAVGEPREQVNKSKGFFRLDDGRLLRLLTPDALKKLPYGTPLVDVNGDPWVSGKDDLDDDVYGGLTGYGILVPDASVLPELVPLGRLGLPDFVEEIVDAHMANAREAQLRAEAEKKPIPNNRHLR